MMLTAIKPFLRQTWDNETRSAVYRSRPSAKRFESLIASELDDPKPSNVISLPSENLMKAVGGLCFRQVDRADCNPEPG